MGGCGESRGAVEAVMGRPRIWELGGPVQPATKPKGGMQREVGGAVETQRKLCLKAACRHKLSSSPWWTTRPKGAKGGSVVPRAGGVVAG